VTALNFPEASPDLVPTIAASQNPVTVRIKALPAASLWTLTVLANGDLLSGVDTIPIDRIRWTASGTGFVSGRMSKTTPQLVASGVSRNDGQQDGTMSFFLDNSWSFPPGSFSQSVVFTLVVQ
jgi:hypothetical protein